MSQGDEAVEYIQIQGGAPGIFGYFRFRCKTVALTDDICLCLLDETNERLLLEGFNHRYIVRKEEITGLHSIDVGHNPAVEVCYKTGEEDLAFVLHKGLSVGYISTTLFLNPMLVKNPSLKLYKQISRALVMGDKK